jgi:bifunctional DNA-binding transcriptional regulator/antitoxin component of YhaV-PrlF toxin-antitoxin module
MTKVININPRGPRTLPKELRRRLGLPRGGQIVAEETPEGLLLRPGATLPVEIYTDKRLAEFARNNEEAVGLTGSSHEGVPGRQHPLLRRATKKPDARFSARAGQKG